MLSISNFLSDFFKESDSSNKLIIDKKINKLINEITGDGSAPKKIVSIRVIGGLKSKDQQSSKKEIFIDYLASLKNNQYNNKSNYINQFYSPTNDL
jgi:hypothetical protein